MTSTIGTASALSAELREFRPQMYIKDLLDNVTLTLHNMMLTSQKPCQHNNKCNCSKTSGFNKISLQGYFIENYINFIYSAD